MSPRRRLILAALTVAAAPLPLEGVVRLRAYARYGLHDDIYDLFVEHPAGMLMARPDLAVDFARCARIETDSHGFRSPEVASPKPDGTIRLAFLGGSTTFCGRARTNEHTWPQLLVERLGRAHDGVSFEHLNAGVTGASIESSRLTLSQRVAPLEPDVVVIVHAAKDLADDTRALALEQGLLELPRRSWLERHSKLWMLVTKNLRHRASQRAGRCGRSKLVYDPDLVARGFAERLATLVHEAQQVAEVVVLATFPIKARADQPRQVQLDNLAQAFTFTPYLDCEGVVAGYDAYNRAIARVAAETGALLVAGHEDLPATAEYFSDSVHLTERGYEATAARFEGALAQAAPFLDLVRRARGEVSR